MNYLTSEEHFLPNHAMNASLARVPAGEACLGIWELKGISW